MEAGRMGVREDAGGRAFCFRALHGHGVVMASQSQSTLTEHCMNSPCTQEVQAGQRIAINQVEYSNSPEGPIIHIFGRNVQGKAVRLDVTGFKPYFYVPADQAETVPLPQQVTLETGPRTARSGVNPSAGSTPTGRAMSGMSGKNTATSRQTSRSPPG